MSEQKDNQALEDYLKGNSFLSRRYREEAMAEPSPQLDATIISAAKKAMENKKTGTGPLISRWYIPLSLAAVVVISFSVVFKIYDLDVQQKLGRQSELKSDKPATLMEGRMEHDAGEPAGIMKDKIISIDSLELKKESGSRKAPGFRKDTTPDASDLSQEIAPSATPPTGKVQIPAEKRAMESSEATFSADSSVTTDVLAPEQWFEIINQLWFENDDNGAYAGLKNFLEAYPDYPVEELKEQLPEGMDLSLINR